MSYILEALKKDAADSDPVAATEYALQHQPAARSWLPWVILLALVLNAIVLAWVFGPDLVTTTQRSEPAPESLSTPTATRDLRVRPRSRTAPGDASNSQPQPQPQPVISASAPPRQPKSAAAVTAPPTAPTSNGGGGRVLSPEEAARLNLLPPDSVTIGPSAPQTTPQPASPTARRAPGAQNSQASTGRTSAKAAKVIQLAELPPADRQDFPKLEFSTHIFADDPALRAVVVNSKRLAEGESIGEMVLRAVTEDGILVDYRGYRVAVSVLEEWN